MSTQPTPALNPPPPLQLSANYKRIQIIYVCAAAALLCWRFFDATLDLSKLGFVLRAQAAAPYLWAAGVLYLAFRSTVEWIECKASTFAKPISRFDFWVTHGFAATALFFLAQQLVSKAKFGQLIPVHPGRLFALSAVATIFSLASMFWYFKLQRMWAKIVGAVPVLLMLGATVFSLIFTARTEGTLTSLAAFTVGLLPLLIFVGAGILFFSLFLAVMVFSGFKKNPDDDDDDPSGPKYTDFGGY